MAQTDTIASPVDSAAALDAALAPAQPASRTLLKSGASRTVRVGAVLEGLLQRKAAAGKASFEISKGGVKPAGNAVPASAMNSTAGYAPAGAFAKAVSGAQSAPSSVPDVQAPAWKASLGKPVSGVNQTLDPGKVDAAALAAGRTAPPMAQAATPRAAPHVGNNSDHAHQQRWALFQHAQNARSRMLDALVQAMTTGAQLISKVFR
ncbi:hypothetical protein [Paraburkholderia sediminicola]|uniref:hypothetical protein n=1 Tax=Paraburkholderia sediminicola TaxID=458836 RepID=UPI0038B8BBF9